MAADLHSEGSKDYVVYKIRVADHSGEWTVSRRFRNFETLHRQLREVRGVPFGMLRLSIWPGT